MLNIVKSIIFGIVEGVTEWLPISSTGHMILLNAICKLNVRQSFLAMYLVVIQLGAILAVVVLYWRKLWPGKTAAMSWKSPMMMASRPFPPR